MDAGARPPDAERVQVGPEDPASPDARRCVQAYLAELADRDDRFDPDVSLPATDEELRPPAGVLLLVRSHGEPVDCVALELHGRGPADVKRVWVAPSARGLGLGRRLLEQVEQQARDRGVRVLRLETNRTLVEAVGLSRATGYREVPAFNDEPFAHHWFEKALDRP